MEDFPQTFADVIQKIKNYLCAVPNRSFWIVWVQENISTEVKRHVDTLSQVVSSLPVL